MKYHNRGFLNKTHGTAAFECSVDHDPEEIEYKSVCASFSISDCTRKVELDFFAHNSESVENCRYKLNKLIEELQQFKSNLEIAYSDANFKEKGKV